MFSSFSLVRVQSITDGHLLSIFSLVTNIDQQWFLVVSQSDYVELGHSSIVVLRLYNRNDAIGDSYRFYPTLRKKSTQLFQLHHSRSAVTIDRVNVEALL